MYTCIKKKIGLEVELVGGMHTAVIESAWEWKIRTIY